MDQFKFLKGYRQSFLGKNYYVPLPELSEKLKSKVVRQKKNDSFVVRYARHSIIQHKERKFPILSAAMIDGRKLKKITRTTLFPNGKDNWKKDKRIGYNYQWGKELYTFPDSDFDIGHLTKREDVQWGETYKEAKEHAQMTFYFTNAVPQCSKVNQGIWRKLEDYILKKEIVANNLKCSLFTGAVLKEDDPFFIHEIRGKQLQLPTLFWKVIYYINADAKLCRVGFLVGQKRLLEEANIVLKSRGIIENPLFMDFSKADVHQVEVSLIEELTDMTFAPALDIFKDNRTKTSVLKDIQV